MYEQQDKPWRKLIDDAESDDNYSHADSSGLVCGRGIDGY